MQINIQKNRILYEDENTEKEISLGFSYMTTTEEFGFGKLQDVMAHLR